MSKQSRSLHPKLTIIDTNEGVRELQEYLADKELITFDTETTGTKVGSEIIGMSFCADETEAFYVIVSGWNAPPRGFLEARKPGQLERRVSHDVCAALVDSLRGKSLVMHNAVFDCARVEETFKIRLIDSLHTDTMLLAHLLDENRPVGLKALGAELFGDSATEEARLMKESVAANGGLLTKANYEMYKADPRLLAKYGAKDAWLTYRLFLHLVPELYDQGLDKFFYEDETMPLLRTAVYELNTVGLKVDTKGLLELKKTLESECLEDREFIYREIDAYIKVKYPGTNKKNTFNIGSNQQLSWLMFGVLNLEFGTLTKTGKVVCKALGLKLPYLPKAKRDFIDIVGMSVGVVVEDPATRKKIKVKEPWAYIDCGKKTMSALAPKQKWIERLLAYKKRDKLLKTYVKGILDRTEYGIINPSFLAHGTTSGRFASRNPNFQNLPRDDKRIKNCIVARPGKAFVGADFSQLEVRVFASVSGDENLLAAFKTGNDFYSVIGMEVFEKTDAVPLKDGASNAFGIKYKKLRDDSKVIALAATYGASARQLCASTGKSEDETQAIMDKYFQKFPGVANMMLEAHALAKRDGQVVTMFGRPRRMPEAKRFHKIYGDLPHAELPYEARNVLNLAVNHRIQGTAASVCNRSLIKYCNNRDSLGISGAYVVSQIHDEIIVECFIEDAENVALLLENAMTTAVELPGVALEAIPAIAERMGGLK